MIAHEYGHHIQDLLGILGSRQRTSRARRASPCARELQADCFAGVWAAHATETGLLEPITKTQIDDALDAAAAVGDDRIQSQTQGKVNPEVDARLVEAAPDLVHDRLSDRRLTKCDTFGGSI